MKHRQINPRLWGARIWAWYKFRKYSKRRPKNCPRCGGAIFSTDDRPPTWEYIVFKRIKRRWICTKCAWKPYQSKLF